jgi:organic hydroperoxide reductase OsmC/OhrA
MATETESIALTITQESDYAFRVAFDDTALPALLADEAPPLGAGKGPDPGRLLGAAIGNCLSASLLFALRKFKNQPGTIVARVRVDHARNERGRLRIGKVAVEIALPVAAAGYARIERILALFVHFCTVTESVRAGVPVEVTVRDGTGAVLRVADGSA